ncbi:MAG: DUF3488 domain-containing protein [Myxococcales bacterium]|nr:DUF3488 domain-containing protein [Myxococcales bacterium]
MNLSFLQLHKLSTYLLAAVGFLALLIPGVLFPLMWLLVLGVLLLSWRLEPPRIQNTTYRQTWTQLTVALFVGGLLLAVFGIFSEPILVGAYLLIVLQCNKLCNRSERRDYLHIYLISFLMLTLGSVLNVELSYGALFILYVVFATWSLILFHLRRELEETQLTRHDEEWSEGERVGVSQILHSRSLIRGSFLASTSLMALLVFLGSSVFFVVFPRVGFRVLFQRKRVGPQMAGFSDRVKLGSFGRIQQNRQVVLRVEISGESKNMLNHYFRGLAFDYYDGKEWRRSAPKARRRSVQFGGAAVGGLAYSLGRFNEEERDNIVYQEIYQEPLPMNVLFGVEQPRRIKIPFSIRDGIRNSPQLSVDPDSDTLFFSYPPKEQSGMRFYVESVPSEFRPFRRRMRRSRRQRMLRLFTQMPEGVFSPRLKELALRITRGQKTLQRKARAIEDYLRKTYSYSLERGPFKGNPLEDFLFRQKKGHCEYFSTAMIMLLRSLDIPARQVTGFLGAEWNPYGEFYAVRQSHAHSWVEVLDISRGWYRFDPTPYRTDANIRKASWLTWAEDRFDALRLQWYKWVVEYDIESQISVLRDFAARFRSARQTLGAVGASGRSGVSSFWQVVRGPLFLLLLLGLIGFVVWRFVLRKPREISAMQAFSKISAIYLEMLDTLALRGLQRRPAETPTEFAQRLVISSKDVGSSLGKDASTSLTEEAVEETSKKKTAHENFVLPSQEASVFSELTERYTTLRFSQGQVSAQEIEALAHDARDMLSHLAQEDRR